MVHNHSEGFKTFETSAYTMKSTDETFDHDSRGGWNMVLHMLAT